LLFRGRLRRAVSFVVGAVAGLSVDAQDVAQAGVTMRGIETRGYLRCGVDVGLTGFAEQDDAGVWHGFDVDLCRAYAVAILGNVNAVRFVPLTTSERFNALENDDIDILIRNTSWTFARDVGSGFDFSGIAYFDGQGFMAPADLGITSARDLDGARVCVQAATTSELNLVDYIETNALNLQVMAYDTALAGLAGYAQGECDVYTNDLSSLAGLRVSLDNPDEHILLPDVISKEPLGPVIREDDARFADVSRWILNALIAAEELGITSQNAGVRARTSANPEVQRLLGVTDDFGERLGLDADYALTMIEDVGNYAEIFERNLGSGSALGLQRGLNAQWTEGGLLYAPPFR
tara:strand:- start:2598 stop:3644 length:1047 start_codon:yes stop_codon:yes gene_type:complete